MKAMGLASSAWLAFLAFVVIFEIATHTGSRNPFLESSRPVYSAFGAPPHSASEGYLTFAGDVPVQFDATSIMALVSFFMGERGVDGTGILDHRSGYAYLSSLMVPWAGPYVGFMIVNVIFWWGACASTWWLIRQRSNKESLARATSFLVATGNGFLFMAGLPMSYLAAYASFVILLALAEWLGAFGPKAGRWSWLLLGWGGGVASVLYFAHIPTLIFWWTFGARRVPLLSLCAATSLTLGISVSWALFGSRVVGLGFASDNSVALTDSLTAWVAHLREPLTQVLTYFRAATVGRTLTGAFPTPWWILAGVGVLVTSRADREWLVAVVMAGLVPAIVILSLLPLSRAAFYMYPAVYLLAAQGALVIGDLGRVVVSRFMRRPREAGWVSGALVVGCLGVLMLTSNADLFGNHYFTVRFHFTPLIPW
ncbi:MAG: hypothetical protein ACR2NO_01825 [Chloroflexota bacterium]